MHTQTLVICLTKRATLRGFLGSCFNTGETDNLAHGHLLGCEQVVSSEERVAFKMWQSKREKPTAAFPYRPNPQGLQVQ